MKKTDDQDREYTREITANRAHKYREALRRAGLRPVQIWVSDTRHPGFPAECRRQCLLVREALARRRRWIKLRRGDLIVLEARAQRRAGTRPPGPPERAVVLHSERFEAHSHLAVLPLTCDLRAAPLLRVTLAPSDSNLLLAECQVMIDQPRMIPRRRVKMVFGHLDEAALLAVDRALAVFLGIGVG